MRSVFSIILFSLLAISISVYSHESGKKKGKKKACCTQMQSSSASCSKDAKGGATPACCAAKASAAQVNKDAATKPTNATENSTAKPAGHSGCNHGGGGHAH
ncbi:MAG: hypothetical protein KF706_10080 [Chitinophagales bacterium]|nr:hypothetical protein [Chitinophagales bacterium]